MDEKQKIIISICKSILDEPKQEYENITQFEFNCPTPYCRNDSNKYNLSFNIDKGIFKCWKCNYKGIIHRLIEDYGSDANIEQLNAVLPKKKQLAIMESAKKDKKALSDDVICELPEEYRPLTKKYYSKYYRMALEYLRRRGIGDDIIKKYEIGYTEAGPKKFRIIIPSKNVNGDINYYEARSFVPKSKLKYIKPESPNKSDIIFNAFNINFDLPVYLVEGVFDMFPLHNAIPLLGKDISDLLLSKLIKHKTRVVLCLDEDALKDSVKLYGKLTELGLDVYFVEIKDDIAKHFEKYGHQGIIDLLKKMRKLDFKYIFSLSIRDKEASKNKMDEKFLAYEWNKIKRGFEKMKQDE